MATISALCMIIGYPPHAEVVAADDHHLRLSYEDIAL